MNLKSLAAVAFAVAMATAAPAARAEVDVDITIHLGYGGFYGKNITCRTGARIVDSRFNQVTIRNCSGRHYDYTGRRNGKWYFIKVDSFTGRIVAVSRWFR